ncbi:DMT family transporter [Pseudooceanicola aestuarii]|uniref:DMT family transporter n=1 Tax=Pseudooceanicola aestuarii TaxID=2697319 RepID=UPI001EF7AE31|nr:DMT family transporter [Pseudooceanicola aestuarii]
MDTQLAPARPDNLRGALWMIAAMAAFAVEDALLKGASRTIPVGQILAMFGLGGTLIFAAVMAATRQRFFPAEAFCRPMRLRVLFEITGRIFYLMAISLTPLSAATVILQATPIVVVAGAALVFGETVGWRRWTAICIGLLGVVVIVQPGTDGFSPLSLLAILGMLGFACRDLASRAAPAALGTALLGFYGFASYVLGGVGYAIWQGVPPVWPGGADLAALTGAVLAGTMAYACLMKAMRTGEISAVTPFRYTRLIFGILLGVQIFGETLTPAMLLGSGLIVLSGLFILARGRQAPAAPR